MAELPRFLKEIIDGFTPQRISTYSAEYFLFFILPKKFFKKFFASQFSDQVSRIVFYCVLSILINYLIFEGSTISNAYKILLYFSLLSIPFFIINSISHLILSRRTFKPAKALLIPFIILIIPSLPAVFFFSLFLKNENYLLYFFSNFFFALFLFFSVILYWIVVSKTIKQMLAGILLVILIMNVSLVLLKYVTFDNYSSYAKSKSLDPIWNDFQENIKGVKFYPGTPFSRIDQVNKLNNAKKMFFVYKYNDTFFADSTFDQIEFKQLMLNNIKLLDSAIVKTMFKRTKHVFESLREHYQLLQIFADSIPCSACLINRKIYVLPTDTTVVAGIENEYHVDSMRNMPLIISDKETGQIAELSQKAYYPFTLFNFFLKPAFLFLHKYSNDEKLISIDFN